VHWVGCCSTDTHVHMVGCCSTQVGSNLSRAPSGMQLTSRLERLQLTTTLSLAYRHRMDDNMHKNVNRHATHLQNQLGHCIWCQLWWCHLKCCQCSRVWRQLPCLQVAGCWQGLRGRQGLQSRPDLARGQGSTAQHGRAQRSRQGRKALYASCSIRYGQQRTCHKVKTWQPGVDPGRRNPMPPARSASSEATEAVV
jgi:hypothetical protein